MILPSNKNLTYFIAVARHLNFSKAASACFVSQSTLSTGISKLEQDLQVKLIERNNKSVQITALGKKVLVLAKQIISHSQDLVKLANIDFTKSQLKIGLIPTIAPFLLTNFSNNIKKQYPQLSIAFIEQQSSTLLNQIEQMDIDFAFFAFPFDMTTDVVTTHTLFTETLHLVHHQNSTGQIKDGSLILLEQGHCLREHIVSHCRYIKKKHISATACNSLATVLTLVNENMGISFLPDMAIKSDLLQHYPNIVISQKNSLTRDIGIVLRKNNPQQDNLLTLARAFTNPSANSFQ